MKTHLRRIAVPAVIGLVLLAISFPLVAQLAGSNVPTDSNRAALPWGLCPLIAAPLFPILHLLLPP
jgi:hypothetical protein